MSLCEDVELQCGAGQEDVALLPLLQEVSHVNRSLAF